MRYAPLGDHAVLITLGDTLDEATHRLVREATLRIASAGIPGVTDVVPAFVSVAVHYAPSDACTHEKIVTALDLALADARDRELPAPKLVEIPVCYGGELGPDLDDVARAHELSTDDIVALHSGAEYLVYMVGFMPGFAYLGGLPDQLTTPRRSTPRAAVPAGTVGIGGQQTGVYPLESPGGWNLIGRTPVSMFDIRREQPTLLCAGDRVRFTRISRREFDARSRDQ